MSSIACPRSGRSLSAWGSFRSGRAARISAGHLEKSKFVGSPPPGSQTLTYQQDGQNTGSPAQFAKLIAEDTEKWAKVIRAANIKVD
jgi:hypothetical protein